MGPPGIAWGSEYSSTNKFCQMAPTPIKTKEKFSEWVDESKIVSYTTWISAREQPNLRSKDVLSRLGFFYPLPSCPRFDLKMH